MVVCFVPGDRFVGGGYLIPWWHSYCHRWFPYKCGDMVAFGCTTSSDQYGFGLPWDGYLVERLLVDGWRLRCWLFGLHCATGSPAHPGWWAGCCRLPREPSACLPLCGHDSSPVGHLHCARLRASLAFWTVLVLVALRSSDSLARAEVVGAHWRLACPVLVIGKGRKG